MPTTPIRGSATSNAGSRSPRSRRRLATQGAMAALTGAALLVALAPGAQGAGGQAGGPRRATGLPARLAKFAHCPVDAKAVSLCLFSSTDKTTFQIGSTTVTSRKPATVSLGVIFKPSGKLTVVLPDDGSAALQSPPIPLPGGLLGIPGLGGPNQVTVTPQLVGLPTLSLNNLVGAKGTGLRLPIDVLVSTPTGVLGPDCTIAGPAAPIALNLTTGTTRPPPPNAPEKGAPGKLSSASDGLITITGMKLVDNAFAVSGAENCGTGGTLDEILDLDKGLPSAAGSNNAILAGTSYTAPASLVRKYVG
jgi:hypothetical protein